MIGKRSRDVKRRRPDLFVMHVDCRCASISRRSGRRSFIDRSSIAASIVHVRETTSKDRQERFFVAPNVLIASVRRCYSAPSSKRKAEATRSVLTFVNRALTILFRASCPDGVGVSPAIEIIREPVGKAPYVRSSLALCPYLGRAPKVDIRSFDTFPRAPRKVLPGNTLRRHFFSTSVENVLKS
jgi:hypothetical protein